MKRRPLLYQLNTRYIIEGNLDRVLLRPYPVFLQICFDRLAIEDLSGVILGCAVMAFTWCGVNYLLAGLHSYA